VLIEPTSAVDAHTESRIGAKMVNYRRGGSTLVVTASPLVLEHADHVVVLGEDDRVAGEGTHASLLHETGPVGALYRSIVGRDLDEVNTVDTSGTAKEVNA
jgi:ABC-type multidrug transport system fused ATPase/permease subunit